MMGVVQAFKVKLWERLESPPQEQFGGATEPGFHAPGRTVLVVRQGTGWAANQDTGRHALEAKSVVVYEAGDWVEYGSDGSGDAFEAELYSAADFSEDQRAARLARFFSPETPRPQ